MNAQVQNGACVCRAEFPWNDATQSCGAVIISMDQPVIASTCSALHAYCLYTKVKHWIAIACTVQKAEFEAWELHALILMNDSKLENQACCMHRQYRKCRCGPGQDGALWHCQHSFLNLNNGKT